MSQPAPSTPPAPAKVVCASCHKEVPVGLNFCPMCGRAAPYAEVASPAGQVSQPMRKCPGCGRDIPIGLKFCPYCGRADQGTGSSPLISATTPAAAPPTRLCPGCGRQVPEGLRFCPYCGRPGPTDPLVAQPGGTGQPQTAPAEQSKAEAPSAAPPQTRLCMGCGREVPEGMNFCPYCGRPGPTGPPGPDTAVVQEPETRVCPGCGREISTKHKFCPECGRPRDPR